MNNINSSAYQTIQDLSGMDYGFRLQIERYSAPQIIVDGDQDCTFAPSVSDNYRSRHIGSVTVRAF